MEIEICYDFIVELFSLRYPVLLNVILTPSFNSPFSKANTVDLRIQTHTEKPYYRNFANLIRVTQKSTPVRQSIKQ